MSVDSRTARAILAHLGYGARPGEAEGLAAQGLSAWVDAQLDVREDDDPELWPRLKALRLTLKDDSAQMMNQAGPATRPLDYLGASLAEVWPLTDFNAGLPWTEWFRPAAEVWAATWMRAVYSRWQLREVVADFWHDHFHVAFFAGDQRVTPLLPLYDRDVIRRHAFGNFRHFLEAVATSSAMLRYLNNASSRASPANENYARELFELHTLGAGNYVNHRYAGWREVPKGSDGVARGYIDEDVYEAARAFTGWTIADAGDTGGDERLPGGGGFHYFDGWHDDYQKRVLGVELPSHQEPLADGRRILDLVAPHPATARTVCSKLCRHLVGGPPPAALVETAVAAWRRAAAAPDQIARTLRAIVVAPEFAAAITAADTRAVVKTPFELIASLLRATNAEFRPTQEFYWLMEQTGWRAFNWPTPAGRPKSAGVWLNSATTLATWNTLLAMAYGEADIVAFDAIGETRARGTSARALAKYWYQRLLGEAPSGATLHTLSGYLVNGNNTRTPLRLREDWLAARLRLMVALIGMTPEYRVRRGRAA